MKNVFSILFVIFSVMAFSQGASISLKKKSIEPMTISTGEILKVGDIIQVNLGLNPDGSYRFVQLLNNFNEPIKSADSRAAMMKQPIKFFKEADGVLYAFTKFFAVNIEAGLKSKEIEIIPDKK